MRKATKFQPNIKDVSEITAKLQKGGHSDLIPVFLGQNATLTKSGRVSTKKGVNDSFDPSRTAYRKGFSVDDFINEFISLGKSVGQATMYPVDLALQANIEKHKAKELRPKFKPKDDRRHIADRVRKNAEKVLDNKFLAVDPDTKQKLVESMRDAGLKVSDDGKVSIPRNLSEEQLRKIEQEEVVQKPSRFKKSYEVVSRDFFADLREEYYTEKDTYKSDWEFYGYGKKFEEKMRDIGYTLRHKGAAAAAVDMLQLREELYLKKEERALRNDETTSDLSGSDLYDRF